MYQTRACPSAKLDRCAEVLALCAYNYTLPEGLILPWGPGVRRGKGEETVVELKKLFEPITIGDVEIRNRLMMAPFGNGGGFGKDDMVSDRLKAFYGARAKGGVGLIDVNIVPYNFGRPTPSGVGVYSDKHIPGLREFTDHLHSFGAKVCAQLMCPSHVQKSPDGPPELIGPSDVVPNPRHPVKVRPATVEEIRQIVETLGEGARRAREAGFDMMEFYALAGNLISQFISPYTNKRTDEYGGSHEKRLRFLLEAIASVQERAGRDFPIICRISGQDFMPGGYLIEDTKIIAPMLERAGVAALHVSTGWHESTTPFIVMSVPRGHWIWMPAAVKEVVNIPVIGGTRINDPILANQVLEDGNVDIVYMGRPLIADPELPNKAREGRFDEIRMCMACNYCFDSWQGQGLHCAINAQGARELEYTIEPVDRPKKVLVIGGGPAGMEAARVATLRGHQVTLLEKSDRLGGQLLVAVIPPYKEEVGNVTRYLETQMRKLNVDVRLRQEATPETVVAMNPDATIVATGGKPLIPHISGVDGDNVVTAVDVLTGRKQVGERVVIVGGGLIGCETAEFLQQRGKKVTVLEMLPRLGNDIMPHNRWVIMLRMRAAGIGMEANAKAVEITKKGVKVERDGATEFFEGDSVVLAVGTAPENALAKALEGKVANLHVVGDSYKPQRIAEAIDHGFRVAREI